MADDERTEAEVHEQFKRVTAYDAIEEAIKAGQKRAKQPPPAQGVALAEKIRATLRG